MTGDVLFGLGIGYLGVFTENSLSLCIFLYVCYTILQK